MKYFIAIIFTCASVGCGISEGLSGPFSDSDVVRSAKARLVRPDEGEALDWFAVPSDRIEEIVTFFRASHSTSNRPPDSEPPTGEVVFETESGKTWNCKFFFSIGKLKFSANDRFFIQDSETTLKIGENEFQHSEATYLERVLRKSYEQSKLENVHR